MEMWISLRRIRLKLNYTIHNSGEILDCIPVINFATRSWTSPLLVGVSRFLLHRCEAAVGDSFIGIQRGIKPPSCIDFARSAPHLPSHELFCHRIFPVILPPLVCYSSMVSNNIFMSWQMDLNRHCRFYKLPVGHLRCLNCLGAVVGRVWTVDDGVQGYPEN